MSEHGLPDAAQLASEVRSRIVVQQVEDRPGSPASYTQHEARVTSGSLRLEDARRRQSLPINFLLPSLWSSNTSAASLNESNHGEHSIDEATAAHRTSALRQLNGAPLRSRRRRGENKSVGGSSAHTTLSSQPVIVRTYSGGTSRPHSRSRSQQPATIREEEEMYDKVELPPVEAFTFDGILRAIEPDIRSTLDAVAEICARSRYSLANEYGAHLPPQGDVGRVGRTTDSTGAGRSQEHPLMPVEEASSSNERLADSQNISARAEISNDIINAESAAYGSLEDIISTSATKEKPETATGERTHELLTTNNPSKDRISSKAQNTGLDGGKENTENLPAKLTLWKRGHTARSKSASWATLSSPFHGEPTNPHDRRKLSSPMELISGLTPLTQRRTSTVLIADNSNPPLTSIPSPNLKAETSLASREEALTLKQTEQPVMLPSSHIYLAHDTQIATAALRSRTRKPSLFMGLSSWLSWASKDDVMTANHGSLGAEVPERSSAEGRLRGILLKGLNRPG